MTTYAKYADMYRQRLARSQDARLEMSGHISPVRSHSAAKGPALINQTTLSVAPMTPQPQMLAPNTIHQMHSPNSRGVKNRPIVGNNEIPSHVKLAQDRSAYMTFLEVQLERVTQACNNALSFQDKVEAISIQVNGQEEKVLNIGRLVKLLQSYSEAQEEDTQTLKLSVRNLSMRLEEVASHNMRAQQLLSVHQNHDMQESGAFGTLTGHQASSVSPSRSKRSMSNKRSPNHQPEHQNQSGTIGQRVSKIESQLKSMDALSQHKLQNSFGTLDNSKTTQIKHDLNNLAQEVDRQMRDTESRIVTNLTQHIEESSYQTNCKIDEALLLLDQKVQRLEQYNSATFQRSNVIQSSQILENGRINPAKMEAALNDWLSKVEEQVNQIEDKVMTRASLIDLKSLERRFQVQYEEREVRFSQIEQYCQRIADQSNSRYQEIQNTSLDWEDRFLQIQRHIEQSLTHNEVRRSLLHSGLTSVNENAVQGDFSSIKTLEKVLAKRLGEGVERLGELIKDQAKMNRRLNSRTNHLELKVFGQVINPETSKKKVAAKGPEAQIQSARSGAKQTSAKTKTIKNSTILRHSSSMKSPSQKPQSARRRSNKSFSPPVKDGSQGPVNKRASSSQNRKVAKPGNLAKLQQPESSEIPISITTRHQQQRGSLNNFKTSFEQRLMQDGNEQVSPREILKRARDRSLRELSQSLNESRSPHSHRLQSFVEIENASPNQHRLSTSIHKQQDSAYATGRSSNLHGPVSGQKNFAAQNLTQNYPCAANEFELQQFKQRRHSNREYSTHPQDTSSTEAIIKRNKTKLESANKRKSSPVQRSNKSGKAASKEPLSVSRDRSKDKISAYTLKDLEKREKSLQKRLGIKKGSSKENDVKSRERSASRSRSIPQNNLVQNQSSKDRSLSHRTFKKMNVLSKNTLMSGARGSQENQIKQKHDISYSSQNNNFLKRARKESTSGANSGVISPTKIAGQIKTTKSTTNANQPGDRDLRSVTKHSQQSANSKEGRVRSRSAHAVITDNSEPRSKQIMVDASQVRRVKQTAAQEIFHQPFDYHQSSHSQLDHINSRRSSNQVAFQNSSLDQNMTLPQHGLTSGKRQRSSSIEKSREDKKQMSSVSKKSTSVTKQVLLGSKKVENSAGVASRAAKQKLKNLQNKKSNQRLAKLEKMYQELTEIEAKTANQV